MATGVGGGKQRPKEEPIKTAKAPAKKGTKKV